MLKHQTLLKRLALGAVATGLLAGVFLLYLEPGFAIAVVDRIWACF